MSQAGKLNVNKRRAHGALWRSCTAGMTIDNQCVARLFLLLASGRPRELSNSHADNEFSPLECVTPALTGDALSCSKFF
ncbi:hypothetical protein CBM2598_P100002 [Cupriavidus taiwanensis]|uniref:Uncharacterized protein n=1 Tax=Cupriavidus taiwanensis TaxID=164546 RepID=A0A7Z7JF73_9BURK|nr:hypothetical protein CBM2598_P100002 [Cupriavidus taiwanensis]SPC25478.1 hypothetical protein CBM2594_P80003 [Cupriavidus taiwanensis]